MIKEAPNKAYYYIRAKEFGFGIRAVFIDSANKKLFLTFIVYLLQNMAFWRLISVKSYQLSYFLT